MVMAAAMVAGSAVCAEAAVPTYTHGSISGAKMVNFNLRNDSGVALKLSVGSDVVTIAPGKTVKMKLEVGAKIVAEEATSVYPAGTVLSVVSTGLASNTVVLK